MDMIKKLKKLLSRKSKENVIYTWTYSPATPEIEVRKNEMKNEMNDILLVINFKISMLENRIEEINKNIKELIEIVKKVKKGE